MQNVFHLYIEEKHIANKKVQCIGVEYLCFITALKKRLKGMPWFGQSELSAIGSPRIIYPYRTTYWIFLSIHIKPISISILYDMLLCRELLMRFFIFFKASKYIYIGYTCGLNLILFKYVLFKYLRFFGLVLMVY